MAISIHMAKRNQHKTEGLEESVKAQWTKKAGNSRESTLLFGTWSQPPGRTSSEEGMFDLQVMTGLP